MKKSSNIRTGRHCVFELHVYLVFVTKYRKQVFNDEILKDLEIIFRDVCHNFETELVEMNGETDYIELRKVTTTTDLLFYIAIHLLCFYVNKVSYTLMTLLHNVHKEKLYIV